MNPHLRIVSVSALFLLLFLSVGCGQAPEEDGSIAYVSANPGSEYEKTFKDLHLGLLYDFNFRQTQADRTWVTLWVEGYRDGKPTEPSRLIELSYGWSPESDVEGSLGFGIINNQRDVPSFFLFSAGASIQPHPVDALFDWNKPGGSTWGYAIGDEEAGLASGETKILGVYRKVEHSLRTYDYQDPDAVARMIREDQTVLLLKIKVEIGGRP
ncbi:hypothetical protein [Paenibacillus sp.]|uniref:hypothetical protein n=1 Tax=Paenibacillus sp. TaxID=58172 RepID=UPI002811F68C|nr:hypothetical protein [Paenibacillus sp.]